MVPVSMMVPSKGEAVDDRGAQAGVGEGLAPAAEGFVGRHGDGCAFPALGQNLEEQYGAASVQAEVAQFVEADQVNVKPPGVFGGLVCGFSRWVEADGSAGARLGLG
ncbi:hypothetical protein KEM60_01165 [Austwickia sp. TVS 96-490-7B]|nr:hypothetical protein [Austwickia sp. TVS 96-490-7B]